MRFLSAEWKEKGTEHRPLLSHNRQNSNESIPEGRADEATRHPGITICNPSDYRLIK